MKKIGLTALGTSLIATSAFAGSLDVTGGASITFSGVDKGTAGNGFSMSDSVTFSGGGEMDNGWNVTVSYELDSSEHNSTRQMDSRSVKIDTNGMGVITFAGHGGSSARRLAGDCAARSARRKRSRGDAGLGRNHPPRSGLRRPT